MTAIQPADFNTFDDSREHLLHDPVLPTHKRDLLEHGRPMIPPRSTVTDLSGPTLRTGAIEPPPAVLRLRPTRDVFGRVVMPARVWLHAGEHGIVEGVKAIQLPRKWLSKLVVGDVIGFSDARESRRRMRIIEATETGCWATLEKTAYVVPGVTLNLKKRDGRKKCARIVDVTRKSKQSIKLRQGDVLMLTRDVHSGRPAVIDRSGDTTTPARIGCTSPSVFVTVETGTLLWFDGGKIGGVVETVEPDALHVRIAHAAGGARLKSDTSIELKNRWTR
jgi:pyruvate kinase